MSKLLAVEGLNLWLCAGLFIGCLLVDYANAKYIRAVGRYDKFKAANINMFLVVVGGLFTYEYVNNLWYLIPIALGAWVGTYLSCNKVKVDVKRKKIGTRNRLRRHNRRA